MKVHQLYTLYPSTLATKKYDVWVISPYTQREKKISFGGAGYSDYTIHHDKERRHRYQIRHANDNLDDPTSAGFWSYYCLWGRSTNLATSFTHTVARFKRMSREIR